MIPSLQMPWIVSERWIDIKAKDNKGNNKFVVDSARAIQVVFRIWGDDAKTYPAKSRFTLRRIWRKGFSDLLDEVVVDEVDDSAVIEGLTAFPVRYELIIYEKGVRIEGTIRYF